MVELVREGPHLGWLVVLSHMAIIATKDRPIDLPRSFATWRTGRASGCPNPVTHKAMRPQSDGALLFML